MANKARFVLSRKRVLAQYQQVKELADVVSYSLKTNYAIGDVLQQEVPAAWVSVHSGESLSNVKNKQQAWFFAQGWGTEQLLELKAHNVNHLVVDNQADLAVLLSFLEKNPWHIDLLLRMRLKEHTVHTGKHFVFGLFARQVNELIPGLRKNENIKRLGVHVHRKTQNVSEWNLKEELSDALSPETLSAIDLINMGGGIPAVYKNYRAEILGGIFAKIREFRDWVHAHDLTLIIEPGRFIAASPVNLEMRVIAVYNNNVIVNASVYQSAMDTFVANIRMLVAGEQETGIPYTIKGSTPCSTDIFRYRVFLPQPLKVGDTIAFLNAGAYNYAADFCCLSPLETVIVD